MPRYKGGLYKVKDPKGKVISNRFLSQAKGIRLSMEKEGYSFTKVDWKKSIKRKK